MQIQIKLYPSHSYRITRNLFIALVLTGAAIPLAIAQPAAANPAAPGTSTSETLPDSPGATSSTARAQGFEAAHSPQLAMASHTDKYILPDQTVPSLSTSDKVLLGLKDAVSPLAFAGWITAAGYSQLLDSSPNYGTDVGAYGQRLGASVLRAGSEGILSDSIMAPIFHEDPRYYQLGRGHGIFHRLAYAATRTIITRTDSGHTSPNFALVSGNLAGAVLTNAYYPSRNHTVKDTAETFGGSIGGSALGFVVSEFLSDTLKLVHLKTSR